MPKKKKRANKKIFRSATVGFRLDPKLRFAAELAARKQRRSLSSFVEWAVEETIKKVVLDEGNPVGYKTAHDSMNVAWDVDEADRFAKMAMNYPNLLSHDEEVLWKHIIEYFDFWKVSWDKGSAASFRKNPQKFDLKFLRQGFDNFKKFAKGEIDEEKLVSQFIEMQENPQYIFEQKLREKKDGSKI